MGITEDIRFTNRKNVKFYTEIVFVTVLSLVASSVWIEWMKYILYNYFNDNPYAVLIIALVITGLAIILLNYLFSTEKHNSDEDQKK